MGLLGCDVGEGRFDQLLRRVRGLILGTARAERGMESSSRNLGLVKGNYRWGV